MRKRLILFCWLCSVIAISLPLLGCSGSEKRIARPRQRSPQSPVTPPSPEASYPSQEGVALQDSFEDGRLDLSLWATTSQNDFAEMVVDVYDVDVSEETDYRLRLRAATIGTSDETVKFLGVRSVPKVNIAQSKTISFDLDWNDQTNGSYLTAGMYLCPVATDENPRDESNWLALEYVGVPPGKNARLQVARKTGGSLRLLFTEGWPGKQRTGRKIGNQRVDLVIEEKGLTVIENGEELFSTDAHGLSFTQAYLYLQMSSHSNYPAREIYFDNITISYSCDVPMG